MKKITPQRLKNIALYHLERYDAGTVKLRGVLTRRIKKAQMEMPVPDEAFEWVEQVIEQMQNLGYVNDTRYAENMVRRLSQSGKSNTFIKNKLKMEGISESTFETLFSDTDDLTQARLYVRKKKLGRDFQKDLAKLARAGFSYDIARQALSQPDSDEFFD